MKPFQPSLRLTVGEQEYQRTGSGCAPRAGQREHDHRLPERRVVLVPRLVDGPPSEAKDLHVKNRPYEEEDDPEREDLRDGGETRAAKWCGERRRRACGIRLHARCSLEELIERVVLLHEFESDADYEAGR